MNAIYDFIDRVWQRIAESLFVRFDFEIDAEKLRASNEQRSLIFALTSAGFLDWLILSSWCRQNGLGPILVSNRLRSLCLAKPLYFFQALFKTRSYAQLFLNKKQHGPRLLFCTTSENRKPFRPTPSEEVLSKIHSSGENALIVPILFTWKKFQRGAPRTPSEYLMGLSSRPNIFGKCWYLIRKRRDSTVKAVSYIELGKADDQSLAAGPVPEERSERIAKIIRRRILIETNQQMKVILGPRFVGTQTIKEQLLRDPDISEAIKSLSEEKDVYHKRVVLEAYQYLTEIAAHYKIRTVELMYLFLRWMFTKVFEGVEYKPEDLEKLREALKKKSVIYVPCHRSHLDYLILPYVLFDNDIATPYFAAGINLAFWPVGSCLRSGGAFFIRRSFRGNALYSLCLKKYVEYLISQRQTYTFFIEGTRSRTGKMLPPAYGILKMSMEAHTKSKIEDIVFVPVSIAYDQVPEEGSYSKEIAGAKKEKESAKMLIKSRSIIRRKFGKVYLNFGEHFDLDAAHKTALAKNISPTLFLQKTAFELSKEITDITPVTPKSVLSIIMLTLGKNKSIPEEKLFKRAAELYRFAKWCKFPVSTKDENTDLALKKHLASIERSGVVSKTHDSSYSIEPKKRSVLTIYKNNSLHHFLEAAIFLLAVLRAYKEHGIEANREKVVTAVLVSSLKLRNLLKFEFFFDPSDKFRESITKCADYYFGAARNDELPLSKLKESLHSEEVFFLSKSFGDILESYLITLRSLKQIGPGSHEKKTVLQQIVKTSLQLHQQNELCFYESISTQNYSNALNLYENLGFVEIRKEREVYILIKEDTQQKKEDLIKELEFYLDLINQPVPI